MYAWLRRHPVWMDAAIALAPFGLGLLAERHLGFNVVLALAVCVPLIWRRRHPAAVLLWTFTVGLGQLVTGFHARMYDFGIVMAIYSAAAYGPRWSAQLGVLGGMLGGTLAALEWSRPPSETDRWIGVAVVCAPVVVAWAVGDNLRIRRAYLAELEERAARLERERDAQARIAVAAERARIAREMHDVVAHNVSVIVVQADAAGCALADRDLPETATAIDAIARTGRSALTEMRFLLGVLRDASGDGAYEPQPGVHGIGELAEQVPIPVTLRIEGDLREPPPGVGLAAYRIVQEALTNTIKHAGSRVRATIDLRYTEEAIEIMVDDDGHGPLPGGEPGHGLAGMRERAGLFGGTVTAGARPGGGFRVRARLPWT